MLTYRNSKLNLINVNLNGKKNNVEDNQKDYIGYSVGEFVEGTLKYLNKDIKH